MALSLKISIIGSNVIKTMQFEPSMMVYDACRVIRDRIPEASLKGNPNEYGLFLSDEDPKKGVWLEAGRSLEYYLLRNQDLIEYKKKHRHLKVRTLDGSIKTLQVDDSHTIGQLMVTICTRIGIQNHDEYSLVRDLPDDEREKTLTLKRDKSIAKDQKKLEEMKKKLHTDDELDWLDHSKTLREQGVEGTETLLLRRKFFFSDQNVDARDPVQLNLLYVQSRDGIINGVHPVSQEEAIMFGGIQCQIQFGDHIPEKHKSGFFDVKDFMPKEYVKIKNIEKKIYVEHKKCKGLVEVDAKVKYTKQCRSLKTYGKAFFLVKEKMKGKNKLTPRLLGITKDSVVRVDEKTKEIMKDWPLTTVRRWAASPNSFTLDFGDHSDSYYSVQTTEGEQIAQLISGYIDIILKKKKAKDHLGVDGDEESTMYEDNVAPAKATLMQHQLNKPSQFSEANVSIPGVIRNGGHGESHIQINSFNDVQHGKGQHAEEHGLSQAKRALITVIEEGLSSANAAHSQLDSRAQVPTLGDDAASKQWRINQMDLSRHKVTAQVSAMNAATAQLVTLTQDDEPDYSAVGGAVNQISSNLGEFSHDVKMVAALHDDESSRDKLLAAAKNLTGAFSVLLTAAQPGRSERPEILKAASRIGEASQDVMGEVGESAEDMDKAYQDTLLALAKAVASATATLVVKAKNVASTTEDQVQQNRVVSSATSCALATSQLVACTKVVAPTINSPACQEQLIESAKLVARSVEGIVESAQVSCRDDNLLKDLGDAATAVTKALNDLLQHIKKGAGSTSASQSHEIAVDTIITVTDRLFSSTGDAHEMVKQARQLAQATSQLVNSIRTQAEAQTDSDVQKRLLAAAKALADATAKMVEAAKGCASSPNDSEQQEVLRTAAVELRSATNTAASNALKKKLVKKLEAAARQAASSATQLINSSNHSNKYNRNTASQHQVSSQCEAVNLELPRLIQGIRTSSTYADSASAQLTLLNACQDFIQPSSKLIAVSNAAAPTVSNEASVVNLTNSIKTMASALAELRSAMSKAQEAIGTLEVDSAIDSLEQLDYELIEIGKSAATGNLMPLPGETLESSSLQLGATTKSIASAMAQLLTAAAQGDENYVGIASRDAANALRIMTSAVRGVAATTDDRQVKEHIVVNAREVLAKSRSLLIEAKKVLHEPNNAENQQRLSQVAKDVSNAMNNCVNCLPGQRDVDAAIRQITQSSQALATAQFPPTSRNYQEVQQQMNTHAANLNQAASDVVTSARGTPQHLAGSSNRYGTAYQDFFDTGLTIAGITKDQETQGQIVGGLKSVSMVSSKLLLAAKSVSADPSAPNAKNQLAQAARAVTESINLLINICTVSAPGQKECDNALRQIQMMRNVLDYPNEPITDHSYFDCLDAVMDKAKSLGQGMTGISNHAQSGDIDDFCDSVKNFANAVCGLTEATAQAAYLVGVSDAASEPGRPGLVDQSQFSRANQAIQMACQNLTNPASSQQQVLSAATIVAKHTSALCNACRMASSKTQNPVAKRHFVQSAKDVANSTANLVKAIKALDNNFTEENRRKCAEASKPLIDAVDELTLFASSPEFASRPGKISQEAKQAQEPITSSGIFLIDGSCNMLQAAKQLAISPKDPAIYQLYSRHSKGLSDAIKRLIASIKESAPGQRECDHALENINNAIRELDQASISAIGQSLNQRHSRSLQGYEEQMINCAREILDSVDKIKHSAKHEPENLGHLVSCMASYFNPLCSSAIGTASNMTNSKQQMNILDQTKTVAESAVQFVFSSKDGAANPKATEAHSNIETAASDLREVLQDLLQTSEDSASQSGAVVAMIDSISKSISRMDERISVSEKQSFVDFQTNVVRLAKQIARAAQDMVGKSVSNTSELGPLANQLARDYKDLSNDSMGASLLSNNQEIGHRLRACVQDLGKSCIQIVQDAGSLQADSNDQYAKRDIAEHARSIQEKVSYILAALQSSSRGTQACINAASTVSGIIGDLDTTIMFATAGTLNAEGEDSFADHRENILKTAKALVEDTKTLVAGAASNQEQLATAAQMAVKTITRLADVVKFGAGSLGSDQSEAQVLLINAVKDVASALADLISATKNASGKKVDDPAMLHLKESAKSQMVW